MILAFTLHGKWQRSSHRYLSSSSPGSDDNQPSFSVITTLPRSVAIIEELVSNYGAERYCRKVRAIDLPVLALEDDQSLAEQLLIAEIERAKTDDGAEAIVLGCAGMSALCERLKIATGVPVIDGVTAAVKLAEALVGAGYATSKVNSYNYPLPKISFLVR